MTTKCYILDFNPEATSICEEIEKAIPCFTKYFAKSFEFEITCRAEDVKFVEEKLAKFV
jgi:hypothetical protein